MLAAQATMAGSGFSIVYTEGHELAEVGTAEVTMAVTGKKAARSESIPKSAHCRLRSIDRLMTKLCSPR